MIVFENRPWAITLYFTFLMIITSACTIQSQSNQDPQEVQTIETVDFTESKIDTTLRLKFSDGIRSILEDSKGNIWFGSHQAGVCLYDGKKMTYYTVEDGLSDNQTRSIYEDSNGLIWFEGGTGLSSYDGKKITTQTKRNYDSKKDWKSGIDDIWFKGDDGVGYNKLEREPGVYRYDGSTLHYHVFPFETVEGNDFTYSVSTPFARGENGMIWLGTYGAVVGYDGDSFTLIDNKKLGKDAEKDGLHVRSIFEDSKGNLWIGNNGIGVLLYDGDRVINFSKLHGLRTISLAPSGGHSSPPGTLEHVFAIEEDSKGNIWFGDRDTGAWRYDGKALKNYTKKDGLTSNFALKIYATKKGELWLGMDNGNVLQFNGESFDRIF